MKFLVKLKTPLTETKRQLMHWMIPHFTENEKCKKEQVTSEGIMIVFFDIRGVIMIEWVS
jgi:hypothetical protein